jgi:anti-anti-sigma factor
MSANRRMPADHPIGRSSDPTHEPVTALMSAGLADMSASLAASDGTVLATVSRHTEPPPTDAPDVGPLVVVAVAGDLDKDTCDLLEVALTSAVDAHTQVCCDLRRLDFLAAAGISIVLAAHHRAVRHGHRLSVRGAHGIARHVLDLTGMPAVLALED